MIINRRTVIKAVRHPGWALEATYRRATARRRKKNKSLCPRVALGTTGRLFFDRLCEELDEAETPYFRGCSRDEWAEGINVLEIDSSKFLLAASRVIKDLGIEAHVNVKNEVFKSVSSFRRLRRHSLPRYFSILISESECCTEGRKISHCSYIDVHIWRSEETYGGNKFYSSVSTSPVVGRLRPQAITALLRNKNNLDRDREALVYTERFPIDVVYTWVDDSDCEWMQEKAKYSGSGLTGDRSDHPERYRNRDELRFSLRSIEKYAPFVRKIFIVTANQIPRWLDIDHEKIEIISHYEIFRDKNNLPTFNSSSIETQLHHIKNLSEHFLYFNDDFLLGSFCTPNDFFYANGAIKFFPSDQIAFEADIDPDREAYLAADANAIELMKSSRRSFGRTIMKHVPYPCRKSYLQLLEERYQAKFDACASNKFRAASDIRPIAFMQYQFGFADGIAFPSRISHRYLALWKESIAEQFTSVLRRRSYKTFCINDVGVPEERVDEVNKLVVNFLNEYFPFRSSFEK